MAVKIKLTRLGKIRNPQYRVVVADADADQQWASLFQVDRLDAIARALGVSLRTVRRRVAALMEECGVETRFQLAVKLTERGLTGFEG